MSVLDTVVSVLDTVVSVLDTVVSVVDTVVSVVRLDTALGKGSHIHQPSLAVSAQAVAVEGKQDDWGTAEDRQVERGCSVQDSQAVC